MNRKSIKHYLFWIRLKRVYDLLPKNLKRLCLAIGVIVLSTSILDLLGLALFIPLLLLLLEDNYIENHTLIKNLYIDLNFTSEVNFTIMILSIVFILVVSKNIFSIYLTRKQSMNAMTIQTGISALVIKSYLQSGITKLKQQNSNQIVWEINSLPSFFTKSVILPLATFINETIVAIIIGVGLFLYDPKIIMLLAVTIAPFTFLFYRITKRKVQVIQKKQSLLIPQLNSLAQQSIFGYVDVILTNTKEFYLNNFDKVLKENKNLTSKLITFMSIPSKIIEIAIISAITFLIIIGLLTDVDKSSTVKFLGIFALAAYRLIPSFNKMTVSILSYKSYQYTLNYLCRSLSRIEIKNQDIKKSKKIVFNKTLEVKDLNFEYKENEPILKGISLTIKKGETVGIIGKSGSGKTTLINILLGLLEQKTGEFLIDGKPIEDIANWYKKVGYVQQSIFLLDGTIKENIAFGINKKAIDNDKVKKCIIDANLEELISQLPNGIETKVGELGNLISGGQKQRIGIARALYSDAEILFFDEATSALDKETESQITDTLNHLSNSELKLTMVVIAHRYSTLKNCNKIYELEDGKILASKTYNELI